MLVPLMNGEILLESEPGRGTTKIMAAIKLIRRLNLDLLNLSRNAKLCIWFSFR